MLGNKEIEANYFGIEKTGLAAERNKSKIDKKMDDLNEVITNSLIKSIQNKATSIKNLFEIKINNDSMPHKISSGYISVTRYSQNAELDNMVIALAGNNTVDYKKAIKYNGGINPISFRPTYFIEQNIYCKSIQIIGKVLELGGIFQ